MRIPSTLLVPLVLTVSCALASSGDRAPDFQVCVADRELATCSNYSPKSLMLAVTRWSCQDECRYECMHDITDKAIQAGIHVQQYYGKWPFWRFAGMQEPASVFFSILNLVANLRGGQLVASKLSKTHPMRKYYIFWSYININAWIWSTVFHTRDKPFTEKMDYFSAALSILFSLYIAVIRLFHIYPLRRDTITSVSHQSPPSLNLWTIICCLVYAGHITYLSVLPRFDYSYNVMFNLGVGMSHNLLWLLYSLPPSISPFRAFPAMSKSYYPAVVKKAALFVLLTTAATGLELFDFPPWFGVIDAHSLWHLSTALIAPGWYAFLVQDSLDDGWRAFRTWYARKNTF